MKSISCALCIIMWLSMLGVASAGDRVVVIVNSAIRQSLSLLDVKNIYVENITHWHNQKKISVYDLPVASPAREVFSQRILGISAQQAAAAEANRKISNASKNPAKIKSERLVVRAVSRRPAAIGYVSEKAVIDRWGSKWGIRVLFVLE